MHGKCVLLLGSLILISTLPSLRFNLIESKASNNYPVHNLNTNLNYTSIQEAIDANETLSGHTILVDAGIYYENVVVNKSVSLVGESRETTMIDGGKRGIVVNITANSVVLARFTIENSGPYYPNSSICLHCTNFTTVTDNIMKESSFGIELLSSNNSTIDSNQIVDNQFHGIVLNKSHNNTIRQNNLTRNNSEAINLFQSNRNYVHDNNIVNNDAAIWMDNSFYNVFSNNSIQNCTASYMHVIAAANSEGNSFVGNDINNFNRTCQGLVLYSCNNSIIIGNSIKNCEYGLYLASSNGNRIYHNNVVNNSYQAYIFETSIDNAWDDGLEGNYWSDYKGTDTNHDGIGDTSYVIDTKNADNYPLMGTFYEFTVPDGMLYNIATISNFTILDLYSLHELKIDGSWYLVLEFIAVIPKGTVGFCRIVIPRVLIDGPYHVFTLGGNFTPTELPISNSSHAFLYFTFDHSGPVTIVPEFPPLLILPLFMIATLLAVIVYKRKHIRRVN